MVGKDVTDQRQAIASDVIGSINGMNDARFRTDKIGGLNSESQGAGTFIIDRYLRSRLVYECLLFT